MVARLPRLAALALSPLLLFTAACTGSPEPAPTSPAASSAPPSSSASPSDSSSAAPSSSASASEADALLKQHGVSAAHPAAVDAGLRILEQGGNAVDAAVATAFAVAVVEPHASGIGGGGSAIIAGGGTDPVTYDYREVVPNDGTIPESGTGIPGFVAGMERLHAEHGKLEWSQLLQPAIDLAENGFPVSEFLAVRLDSDFGPRATEGLDHFHQGLGFPLGAGDQLVQKELAATMRTLATEGADAFYTGSLVPALDRAEGIDRASLADYEVEKTAPVSGEVGDLTVISAAPPLPGAALIQMLQAAEGAGIADVPAGSADYTRILADAWTLADATVTRELGDPDFVDVPVDRITDAQRNAQLMSRGPSAAGAAPGAGPGGAGAAVGVAGAGAAVGAPGVGTTTAPGGGTTAGGASPIKAGNTTHISVVDSDGLAVSMTNTITNFWGGGAGYVGGFFLNNQLSRFESLDTPKNQPEPGRQSVSWSAPSMVLDGQGRPELVVGTPGGHQIPNILSSVIVRWGLKGQPLQEAVTAPRSHLQDGTLALEEEPDAQLSALLERRSWQADVVTLEEAVFGSVQALEIDYSDGTLVGADDHRREGAHEIAAP